MEFKNSSILYLLLLIPVWGFFLFSRFLELQKKLRLFLKRKETRDLFPSVTFFKTLLQFSFSSLAFACFVLAVAGPYWGYRTEKLPSKGREMMVLVDLSQSMFVKDVSPNRIAVARRKLRDLLDLLEGKERIGLIGYTSQAALLSPLSTDASILKNLLEILSPDLILNQGTDLSNAIELALKSFDEKRDKKRGSQALLVLTDGEDFSEDLQESLKKLREKNIPLYILGIGTLEGGTIEDPITGVIKRDRQGQIVVSKLMEETLQKIASETGGRYTRVSVSSNADWRLLYTEGIQKRLEEMELAVTEKKIYNESFQWFMGSGILLLLLESWARKRSPG